MNAQFWKARLSRLDPQASYAVVSLCERVERVRAAMIRHADASPVLSQSRAFQEAEASCREAEAFANTSGERLWRVARSRKRKAVLMLCALAVFAFTSYYYLSAKIDAFCVAHSLSRGFTEILATIPGLIVLVAVILLGIEDRVTRNETCVITQVTEQLCVANDKLEHQLRALMKEQGASPSV